MKKVLEIALAEVGYLEKASNYNLDSKTGNAGKKNFTKYARDLDNIPNFYNGKKNGFDWCDVFVDWCFVQAYGVELAKKLLCQPSKSLGAGCQYSVNYYKQAGRFHKTIPKPGDQIFFSSGSVISHTGLVYAVDASTVYTVEGNTSGASSVVANGGGVKKKSYSLSYYRIYGYGRPDYSIVEGKETIDVPEGGAKAMIGVSILKRGSKGNEVKTLQALLIKKFGISCGSSGVDGDFGAMTESAVREFQRKKNLAVDGSVGAQTWTELIQK